jgi:hypothetical protein
MATEKIAYGAAVELTFTSLGALAAAAGLTGGAESAAVDNSANLNMDYLLAGNFKTAATNGLIGYIEVWVIGQLEDTLWPDVFDGTDSVETVTNRDTLFGFGKLAGSIYAPNATASQIYAFGPVSVAQLFGGICPRKFVVFVTHNVQTSTNVLAAAAAGPPQVNKMFVTPITFTSA